MAVLSILVAPVDYDILPSNTHVIGQIMFALIPAGTGIVFLHPSIEVAGDGYRIGS